MNACPRPDKTPYENRSTVLAALRGMAKRHRRQGLHPYLCNGCGKWHLGRSIRRSHVAWKALP